MAKGLPARQKVQNHLGEGCMGYRTRIRAPCRTTPALGDMDYVWRSIFEKCVRDIESTKYSSEFKRLCQKELEEFCGRSLGSDDFWNMPKVQNRGKDTRKGSKDIEVDVDL